MSENMNDDETLMTSDRMRVKVFQQNDVSVFYLISFPTETIIESVYGELENGNKLQPNYTIADAYGSSEGKTFNNKTKFKAGDYCMGLMFESVEVAKSIVAIDLKLLHEEVSNYAISQMIFGLYRKLGFDPSHIMNYPIKSTNESVTFYDKTRDEINGLKMIMNAREKHVINSDSYKTEKGITSDKTISITEYQNVKEERDRYLNKLQEAEDYIDDNINNDIYDKTFNNEHLTQGIRSLLNDY